MHHWPGQAQATCIPRLPLGPIQKATDNLVAKLCIRMTCSHHDNIAPLIKVTSVDKKA